LVGADGIKRHSAQYLEFNYMVWEAKGSKVEIVFKGGLHPCNEKDLKKLYKMRNSSAKTFDQI
jgi:hypothetical protein